MNSLRTFEADVSNFMSISLARLPVTSRHELILNQQGTGESFRLCEPQVLKGEVCFLFGRMVTIETQSSLGWRSYQSTKFEFTVTLRNNTKQMSEKKESSWLPLNTMLWFHSRLFMKFSSLSCENNPAFCCADFWRLFCS